MKVPEGYKDFYLRVGRITGTQEKTVKEWWSAFYEQILSILYVTGKCTLPGIGTFVLVAKEEQVQEQTDSQGVTHLYIVPARDYPIFYPEDDFINDVNMQGVTKSYRKRLKRGALTQRDYLRIQRAEKMNISPVETARKIEQECKANFSKTLEKKKAESEKNEKN